MISNGYSLTFVINTIFAIFNSIGISKISSNHVFTRFQNSFTTGQIVMLFTKYYIHGCKWSNNLPTIEVLKAKLKVGKKWRDQSQSLRIS
jgi:hypothetical protein